MSKEVIVLPGDGIGPEVISAAARLLNYVGSFEINSLPIGGASIDKYDTPLTDETLQACRTSDAVLLGAVGGQKWETSDPEAPRPEQGLLNLRKGMELFANLRPVRPSPAAYEASPIRKELLEGVDLLVVRELTGGIYFGQKDRIRHTDKTKDTAQDTCEYSWQEIERIAHVAFRAAQQRKHKLTSVDKANVLETSRLWREVVTDVAKNYPDVELNLLLVDNAAMQIVSKPASFDVILTENMFGDILSDESAMLSGSLGMLPSASLGKEDSPGLFEPIHGSAPDIAGKGAANPLATFLSVALMLRYGLDSPSEAEAVETAVSKALDEGLRTKDLGGQATTIEATDKILSYL